MAEHNRLGKEGEMQAVEYLAENGYTIRETNWRFRRDELDIIAEKNGTLVIVEVKTRRNDTFGRPEDAINEAKIRRILAATEEYLIRNDLDCPIRFDVISLIGEKFPFRIEHIEEAFISPLW